MEKKNIKPAIVLFGLLLLFNLFLLFPDLAEAAKPSFGSGLSNTGREIGYSTNRAGLTLPTRIGQVLFVGTTFVGVVFFAMITYAGYIWLMARGNEQEVTKAKNIITYSAIGLIIVLSAYAITIFISNLWKSSIPPV